MYTALYISAQAEDYVRQMHDDIIPGKIGHAGGYSFNNLTKIPKGGMQSREWWSFKFGFAGGYSASARKTGLF
jgi:hypothetical protein